MQPMTDRLASQEPIVDWRYAPTAVVLHWLLAFLITGMVVLGLYMASIEDDPGAERLFDLHKSVGIVVFALVLVRASWRLAHRPAELPASLPRWEVVASSVVQWLLYACMLAQPVIGFLGASYTKSGVVFFGWRLPRWTAPDHDTAEMFFGLHEAVAWTLVALVAVHALGGLKHLVINRDRVFQRMWF
ncbi:MAG: cytochrome b [Massilia sp.]